MDEAWRQGVLSELTAQDQIIEELLVYNENRFERPTGLDFESLPPEDEPHLEAWREYAQEAAEKGAFEALRQRFAQLRFPVEQGISDSEAYRRATRKGEAVAWDGECLELDSPASLTLEICPSLAGSIPVLVSTNRQDFERLIQAFTARNEPRPVPASMGASMVAGLNNWDRIARYRANWEAGLGDEASATAWSSEWKRLVAQKPLYQDRFVILSSGPYSGVAADALGLDPASWLERSLVLRREHELTHYFTLRVLGSMRNNLLDELIADYVGLVRALGRYDTSLALRFLGLESYPVYRSGGRLENYRGDPPLSEPAMAVLMQIVARAIERLGEMCDASANPASDATLARTIVALTAMTLEEIAYGPKPLEAALHGEPS